MGNTSKDEIIQGLKAINKRKIKEVVEKIENWIVGKGYLSHPIRATEDIFIERLRAISQQKKRDIKAAGEKISKEELEKRIPPHFFRIFINETSGAISLKGVAHVFKYGFEIIYPDTYRTSSAEARIIIAHELGHIMLHYYMDEKLTGNSDMLVDSTLEAQAFYFAKLLILNKTRFYENRDRIEELKINEREAETIIKKIYPDYDEENISN